SHAGSVPVAGVARWNGREWTAVGVTPNIVLVYSLAVFDDGAGPALYAGGSFSSIGGVAANGIAKWDGQNWKPLGNGVSNYINDMEVYDDGSGPALFVVGTFLTAGTISAPHIAKWSGQAWSSVGAGLDGPAWAVSVFNDGTQNSLYIGGG